MAMLIRIWAGGLVIVWDGNGFKTHKKLEVADKDGVEEQTRSTVLKMEEQR